MLKLIGRRVLLAIPTLVGVVLVSFLLVELMPGDPASIMAGDEATPEAIAILREQLELDRPVWARFGDYLYDVARGDLGTSGGGTTPVWDRIWAALPVTLSLGLLAMLMAVPLGVLGGVWAGLRRGRFVDRADHRADVHRAGRPGLRDGPGPRDLLRRGSFMVPRRRVRADLVRAGGVAPPPHPPGVSPRRRVGGGTGPPDAWRPGRHARAGLHPGHPRQGPVRALGAREARGQERGDAGGHGRRPASRADHRRRDRRGANLRHARVRVPAR